MPALNRTTRLLTLLLATAACQSDAGGPSGGYRLESAELDITAGPGDTVQSTFTLIDGQGAPVSGLPVLLVTRGRGSRILQSDSRTDQAGQVSARWMVGTDAAELSVLGATVFGVSWVVRQEVRATLAPDTIVRFLLVDSIALRRFARTTLALSAEDPFGNIFVPNGVSFRSTDSTIVAIDSAGTLTGIARGHARIVVGQGQLLDSVPVSIFQLASTITAPDTVFYHSLGQLRTVPFSIVDDQGQQVLDSIPIFALSDSSHAAVVVTSVSDTSVTVRGKRNGSSVMQLILGSLQHTVTLVVQQQSRRLQILPGTQLGFDALGDSVQLSAAALDSLDVPLETQSFSYLSLAASVADVTGGGLVRSRGNGTALVEIREASGAMDTVIATVSQVAVTLQAEIDSAPILLVGEEDFFPVVCDARDRNGYPIDSVLVSSRRGTLQNGDCRAVPVLRSGFDTLVVQRDARRIEVPFIVALPPRMGSPDGEPLTLDSFPATASPWAPTLVKNSAGTLDLYATAYVPDVSSLTGRRGDLVRLTSTDGGQSFRFDGVVLHRDSTSCSVMGDGIENIAIVPRSEGNGWRMFFAAGDFACYGWQIFSATSNDERTWSVEPGVRVRNGANLPPDPLGPIPWPAGEGIVIDQLPGGEWRMISGSYQPIVPALDKFDIVEHRSADQLNWSYLRPLITTQDVGASAARSVYSPTIREFAPGLYRMIFTGDNLNSPGGRSRLYSAVSIDRVQWHIEGIVLSHQTYSFFYSTLVDSLLVFIRQDIPDTPGFLGRVRIDMP